MLSAGHLPPSRLQASPASRLPPPRLLASLPQGHRLHPASTPPHLVINRPPASTPPHLSLCQPPASSLPPCLTRLLVTASTPYPHHPTLPSVSHPPPRLARLPSTASSLPPCLPTSDLHLPPTSSPPSCLARLRSPPLAPSMSPHLALHWPPTTTPCPLPPAHVDASPPRPPPSTRLQPASASSVPPGASRQESWC
ncbi:hypothetical protein GUJ93_ZPchr0009g1597 [Zizania palustris]|uniref:Uncharacterized protein n=1 Tax=Zizania palustris TaxID=103762 RepID=A0A8J5UZB2_ZIZPA|nr:hypothetical protein GUJ93_ZPchr0009g1597 [Zizania palustris]